MHPVGKPHGRLGFGPYRNRALRIQVFVRAMLQAIYFRMEEAYYLSNSRALTFRINLR